MIRWSYIEATDDMAMKGKIGKLVDWIYRRLKTPNLYLCNEICLFRVGQEQAWTGWFSFNCFHSNGKTIVKSFSTESETRWIVVLIHLFLCTKSVYLISIFILFASNWWWNGMNHVRGREKLNHIVSLKRCTWNYRREEYKWIAFSNAEDSNH